MTNERAANSHASPGLLIFGLVLSSLIAALPGGAALAGASAAGTNKEQAPLVENVTVDIVNLEVVVSDSKGKRVKGLTAADFELLQDERPQRITNFYAVEGGSLVPEKPADGAPAESTPAPSSSPRKTWIVVYIDNQFLSPLHRNRVVKGVEDFLRKNLAKDSEAMIVTADHDFKIRKKFTSRLGDLVEVLDVIEGESAFAGGAVADRSRVFEEIESSKSIEKAESLVRNYAKSSRNDVDFSLGTLKEMLRTLSGLEGRKILLHVSDGIPVSPGRELFEAIGRKFKDSSYVSSLPEFDRSLSFESVVNQANAVGVTIYALDASGLSLEGVGSAETGRPSGEGESLFAIRWNSQDSLKQMADGTGGIAILNKNDPTDALEDLSRDLTNYYSLGFPAPTAGTERIRRLEVKLKKKGLSLRYRRGFSEKGMFQRISEQVVSSLYYPRNDNPLGISVTRGKPVSAGQGAYLVPLDIRIPIGKVVLVPEGEKQLGRVHLYFAVLDSNSRQSEMVTANQDIEVPNSKIEQARRQDFIYETKLLMLPGSQRLSLAVRDEISSQTSFLTSDLFISVLDVESGGARPGLLPASPRSSNGPPAGSPAPKIP